jgi:hypothetical protein
MLRNILMLLGFITAVLPYVGLPYDFTKWVWTIIGLVIVFLLFFSQKGRLHYIPYSLEENGDQQADEARELSVLRHETEDRPEVHIEKEITTDTVIDGQGEREVKVEETKITTIRKRKKRVVEVPSEEIEGPNLGA